MLDGCLEYLVEYGVNLVGGFAVALCGNAVNQFLATSRSDFFELRFLEIRLNVYAVTRLIYGKRLFGDFALGVAFKKVLRKSVEGSGDVRNGVLLVLFRCVQGEDKTGFERWQVFCGNGYIKAEAFEPRFVVYAVPALSNSVIYLDFSFEVMS